jgi:hypothetical protein
VLEGSVEVSPWCIEQVAQLNELGPEPSSWPDRLEGLPAAAEVSTVLSFLSS